MSPSDTFISAPKWFDLLYYRCTRNSKLGSSVILQPSLIHRSSQASMPCSSRALPILLFAAWLRMPAACSTAEFFFSLYLLGHLTIISTVGWGPIGGKRDQLADIHGISDILHHTSLTGRPMAFGLCCHCQGQPKDIERRIGASFFLLLGWRVCAILCLYTEPHLRIRINSIAFSLHG